MIRNDKNGHVYIGKTCDEKVRLQTHLRIAKVGKSVYKSQYQAIHAAIRKYGKRAFSFHIIASCANNAYASATERVIIQQTKALGIYLYNLTDGGEGASGRICSDETRAKMSAAKKGKYLGKNNHRFGKTISQSQKDSISLRHKGKKLSAEHAKKLIESRLGPIPQDEYERRIQKCTKLSIEDVLEIKRLIRAGFSNTEIGLRFHRDPRRISDIRTGRKWARIILPDD